MLNQDELFVQRPQYPCQLAMTTFTGHGGADHQRIANQLMPWHPTMDEQGMAGRNGQYQWIIPDGLGYDTFADIVGAGEPDVEVAATQSA